MAEEKYDSGSNIIVYFLKQSKKEKLFFSFNEHEPNSTVDLANRAGFDCVGQLSIKGTMKEMKKILTFFWLLSKNTRYLLPLPFLSLNLRCDEVT